jgi:hypothetical protein
MRSDEREHRTIAEAVMTRLRALREQHPDAQVTTELLRLDEAVVVVRAAIVLPNGGSATGFGTSGAGGHDAVEEAETRALNRTLTVLGYPPETPPARATMREEKTSQEPVAKAAEPETDSAAPAREPAAQREEARSEAVATTTSPAPAKNPVPVDDDPPLEDYSWTEFWKWARSLGYGNKQVVEDLINQSITSLSPAEVRALLREKTGAQ